MKSFTETSEVWERAHLPLKSRITRQTLKMRNLLEIYILMLLNADKIAYLSVPLRSKIKQRAIIHNQV